MPRDNPIYMLVNESVERAYNRTDNWSPNIHPIEKKQEENGERILVNPIYGGAASTEPADYEIPASLVSAATPIDYEVPRSCGMARSPEWKVVSHSAHPLPYEKPVGPIITRVPQRDYKDSAKSKPVGPITPPVPQRDYKDPTKCNEVPTSPQYWEKSMPPPVPARSSSEQPVYEALI